MCRVIGYVAPPFSCLWLSLFGRAMSSNYDCFCAFWILPTLFPYKKVLLVKNLSCNWAYTQGERTMTQAPQKWLNAEPQLHCETMAIRCWTIENSDINKYSKKFLRFCFSPKPATWILLSVGKWLRLPIYEQHLAQQYKFPQRRFSRFYIIRLYEVTSMKAILLFQRYHQLFLLTFQITIASNW